MNIDIEDLHIFVTSDHDAKRKVARILSERTNISANIIEMQLEIGIYEDARPFIVHKKTKSCKDKILYVSWFYFLN